VLADNRNITVPHLDESQHVPQGSFLGPFIFFLYINALPKITTNNAKLVLYADDTSRIVTNLSPKGFKIDMNNAFVDVNE
jgi:hypothetical protein